MEIDVYYNLSNRKARRPGLPGNSNAEEVLRIPENGSDEVIKHNIFHLIPKNMFSTPILLFLHINVANKTQY